MTLDMPHCRYGSATAFVTEVWQIYALVFLFSPVRLPSRDSRRPFPTFFPTKRPPAPRAMSRLAYDLQIPAQPCWPPFCSRSSAPWLFLGNAISFIASGPAGVPFGRPAGRQGKGTAPLP